MRNLPLPSASLSRSLAGLTALVAISAATAAPLTNYNFVSGSATSAVSDPNVPASPMTSLIGTVGTDSGFSSSAANAFVRANATQASEADAITADSYFSFTLTPQSGVEFDLTSFSMTVGNQTGTVSASFTSSYFVRTSLDGYASNIGISSTTGATTALNGVASRTTSSNSTSVGDSVVFTVSGTAFQDISTAVTFRIYLFDTGTAGAADSNQSISRFDSVQIAGTVSAVPEPASGVLLLIGGILTTALRRRTGARR